QWGDKDRTSGCLVTSPPTTPTTCHARDTHSPPGRAGREKGAGARGREHRGVEGRGAGSPARHQAGDTSRVMAWPRRADEPGRWREARRVRYARVDHQGALDLDDFRRQLTRVSLVAVSYVTNALGVVNPVKEVLRLVAEAGALTLVDASQAVAHLPIDVHDLG